MDNRIVNDSRTYTDIQDLDKLRGEYKSNAPAVKKEVAQQFEAMLMQMVLHSMRDANKQFASGLFGDDQMDIYQDMFDKQLTLSLSTHDLGFAKMVEENVDRMQGVTSATTSSTTAPSANTITMPVMTSATMNPAPVNPQVDLKVASVSQTKQLDQPSQDKSFTTEEEFVKKLLPAAKAAASALGTNPGILLAQAALETQWGKKILANGKDSTHNLFNIKADAAWKDKTVTVATLEQKNGVLVKEKSNFRTYGSFEDSFNDYVNFLKQNVRYKGALDKAAHPSEFITALHSAGYATDSHYSEKILKIFASPTIQNIAKLK